MTPWDEKKRFHNKHTHAIIHMDETQDCSIDISSAATNTSSHKFEKTLSPKVGPAIKANEPKERAKITSMEITPSVDNVSTDLPGVSEQGEVRNSVTCPDEGSVCFNLTATRGPMDLEIPLTEVSKQLEPFAIHGLSKRDREELEASRERVPRFLFRCFGPKSGGHPDLNTIDGIIPRGFLDGSEPTDIYETDDLRTMIINHLEGSNTRTKFSSWSSCITYAMKHASDKSYIAIIDRALLAPYVKVYHVPDLCKAGLCGVARVQDYIKDRDREYLAYGPIYGPGFHYLQYDVFRKKYERLFLSRIYNEGPSRTVVTARELAGLFRHSHDYRPDIFIALTIIFSCLQFFGVTNKLANELKMDFLDTLILYLRRELKIFDLPPVGNNQLALINPEMYVGPYRNLQETVYSWKYIEEKIWSGEIAVGEGDFFR